MDFGHITVLKKQGKRGEVVNVYNSNNWETQPGKEVAQVQPCQGEKVKGQEYSLMIDSLTAQGLEFPRTVEKS